MILLSTRPGDRQESTKRPAADLQDTVDEQNPA